jgi:Putative Flp pilus-assembly TadE/G-like
MKPPQLHLAGEPLRRRVGNEEGQLLPLLGLLLAALLGISAVVIDVGRAYLVQRNLQSSADAAALAAAQELPSESGASTTARAYSSRPGGKNERAADFPTVTTTVDVSCRSHFRCAPVNAVEVREAARVPAGLARVFGLDYFDVSARAVAAITQGNVPWAIFAYDQTCGDVVFRYNGNVFEVDGGIHSNGNFEANGINITAGYASSGGPRECEPTIDGDHIDFGGHPAPVFDPSLLDWPVYFEESDFPCDFRAKQFKFNTHNVHIPEGVYCASELFEVNANYANGRFTAIAPKIIADGNNQQLDPYLHGVLFFATGTQEMVLNGNSYDWEGIMFAPRARVKINGNADSTLTGMIAAMKVEVNGEAFRMFGTGPQTAGVSIALVE